MKSTEFCYWLQGLFELGKPDKLNGEQVRLIKAHLDMVFVHEIDPSYPAEQQTKLNKLHDNGAVSLPENSSGVFDSMKAGPLMRC